MNRRVLFTVLALSGVLLLALAGDSGHAGWKKTAPPAARTDLYGDPLPPFCTARLGTVQWRQPLRAELLAFSPDDKTLTALGYWGGGGVWDVRTGQRLRELPERARYVAMSADAKLQLTGEEHRGTPLTLWSLATGKQLRQLEVKKDAGLDSLALSADGKVAAAAFGYFFVVWDTDSGKVLCEGKGLAGHYSSIQLSPKGDLLAGSGVDGPIRLWDVVKGKQLHDLGKADGAWSLDFSPDGSTLAAGYYEKPATLWKVATGGELGKLADHDHVTAVKFSPDGKFVASGDWGGDVRLWEVATAKLLHKFQDSWEKVYALAFSHEGKFLACGCYDETIRLWDVATGKPLHQREGHRTSILTLAMTPDGKTLFSASDDGAVGVWSTATAKKRGPEIGGNQYVNWVVLSVDGTLLAHGTKTAQGQDALSLRNLRTNKELWTAADQTSEQTMSLDISPDGKTIAQALTSHDIALRETATGKLLHAIRFESPFSNSERAGSTSIVKFSPDGKLLVAGGSVGLRVWDASTRQHLYFFNPDKKRFAWYLTSLAFSPDGRTLAAVGRSSKNGDVHLLDALTGKPMYHLTLKDRNARSATFSPDGRLLAVGDWEGGVSLFEAASGQRIATVQGHRSWVNTIAFFPDGRRLATGSKDTTLLLWDTTSYFLDPPPAPEKIGPKELAAWWQDLGKPDAPVAYRSLQHLAAAHQQAVPFLGKQLEPLLAPETKQVRRLIADLGDGRFKVREEAAKELTALGKAAAPALRKALTGKPAAEVRRRVEGLLAVLERQPPPREQLQGLRAVAALERAGTVEARRVLLQVADTSQDARLALEARSALGRLAKGLKTVP